MAETTETIDITAHAVMAEIRDHIVTMEKMISKVVMSKLVKLICAEKAGDENSLDVKPFEWMDENEAKILRETILSDPTPRSDIKDIIKRIRALRSVNTPENEIQKITERDLREVVLEEKGNHIRQLKANHATREEVNQAIQEYKQFKLKLEELQGKDFNQNVLDLAPQEMEKDDKFEQKKEPNGNPSLDPSTNEDFLPVTYKPIPFVLTERDLLTLKYYCCSPTDDCMTFEFSRDSDVVQCMMLQTIIESLGFQVKIKRHWDAMCERTITEVHTTYPRARYVALQSREAGM